MKTAKELRLIILSLAAALLMAGAVCSCDSGDDDDNDDNGLQTQDDDLGQTHDDDSTGSDDDVQDDDDSSEEPIDVSQLEVDLPHRAAAPACQPTETHHQIPDGYLCNGNGEPGDECAVNEDCQKNGKQGYCLSYISNPIYYCYCLYEDCLTDEDCPEGTACACAGSSVVPREGDDYGDPPNKSRLLNECVPAECRLDSDCASGLCLADRARCDGGDGGDPMYFTDFRCATDRDRCRSDDPCVDENGEGWVCTSDYRGEQGEDLGSTPFECIQFWGASPDEEYLCEYWQD